MEKMMMFLSHEYMGAATEWVHEGTMDCILVWKGGHMIAKYQVWAELNWMECIYTS